MYLAKQSSVCVEQGLCAGVVERHERASVEHLCIREVKPHTHLLVSTIHPSQLVLKLLASFLKEGLVRLESSHSSS